MASSNFTTNLQLSAWDETDKPERIDFVTDNEKIDKTVGEHILNSDIHVTSDEKLKISEPFVTMTVYGTGVSVKTITLSFEPKMVIYFASDCPISVTNADGVNLIYAAIALQGKSTDGMSLQGNFLELHNIADYSSYVAGDKAYQLNVSGKYYNIIAFR